MTVGATIISRTPMLELLKPPGLRGSDDEHISRLRRSMANWDRYRYWLFFIYVLLLFAIAWIPYKLFEVVIEVGPNVPIALGGFFVGIMLGMNCGWMIFGILHGLASCINGFRTERLLLRYHDSHEIVLESLATLRQSNYTSNELEDFGNDFDMMN
jgi:hypothetical protein